MRRNRQLKGWKWKYAEHAHKLRRCESCGRRLRKSEAHLCKSCYAELLGNNQGDADERG